MNGLVEGPLFVGGLGLGPLGRVGKDWRGPRIPGKKIVHVGETFNSFAQKCAWRPGSARARCGSYSAPSDP